MFWAVAVFGFGVLEELDRIRSFGFEYWEFSLSSAVDLAVYCFSVLRSSLSLSVFDVGVVGYIGVLWWAVLWDLS